jgi:hypothetical protein
MVEGQGRPDDSSRSDSGTHEEFLKLCALLTSGSLSEAEQTKLRKHLAGCLNCRKALEQYERVVDQELPALATPLADPNVRENPSFDAKTAEQEFFKRLSEEDQKSPSHLQNGEPWLSPLVIRQSRNFRRRFERFYFWLPMTAAILLCASLGVLAYRTGVYRGMEVGMLEQATPPTTPSSDEQTLEVASRERDSVNAQLRAQDKVILELQHQIARERSENAELEASQSQDQLALRAREEEQKKINEEHDHLLQQATAEKDALQAKLDHFERERSQDAIRSVSLESKVAELSESLAEQQRLRAEEDEVLEKDRDIRELMGARDLYVAEVHDVTRTGETEKAFGRVFYTKGKSLIFYAYDLNEQPGTKDAGIFEAWGRRGPDWSRAYKLGAFYEDNVAKKRWVMKFSDRTTLDQIDAVFVTVEPHGGSARPTGKPLLFVYLKVAPNHP